MNVNVMGIAGTVSHTAQWETNRVNYNFANYMSLRTETLIGGRTVHSRFKRNKHWFVMG
ncbi:hypothetical protein MKZ23_31070 [Paenibacillus sp. FSL R5-0876]|uniref:hypothetical protein n=1 Tax=unclassified Paenibacillus TaxID=185978 RepID=UPI0030FA4B42